MYVNIMAPSDTLKLYEWLLGVLLIHIEDCEGWWLFDCCTLLVSFSQFRKE